MNLDALKKTAGASFEIISTDVYWSGYIRREWEGARQVDIHMWYIGNLTELKMYGI